MNEKKICACVGARTRDTQKSKEHYEENFIPAGWNLEYTCLDQPEVARALYLTGVCLHCGGQLGKKFNIPGELTVDALLEQIYHQMESCRPFDQRFDGGAYRTSLSMRAYWYMEQDDLTLGAKNAQFLKLFHAEDQGVVEDWISRCHAEEPYTAPRRDRKSTLLRAVLERARACGDLREIEPILDYYLPNAQEPLSSDLDSYLTNYQFSAIANISYGCEGIFVDLAIEGNFDDSGTNRCTIGTFKTLRQDNDADRLMGQLCGILTLLVKQASEAAAQTAIDVQLTLMSWGTGPDNSDPKSIAADTELVHRVQQNDTLMKVARYLGRLKELMEGKRKNGYAYGRGEKYTLELGADLSRALASEFVLLALPETTPLFLRKLQKKGLKQYQRREAIRKGSGDIICMLDESDSAEEAAPWCKAVALALLDIAMRDQRRFAMIHFSGKGHFKTDLFIPRQYDQEDVLRAAELFLSGGTNYETPLQEALRLMEESGFENADMVFITDGACELPSKFRERLSQEQAKRGFHITGVLLDQDSGAFEFSLAAFCDEIIRTSELTREQIAERLVSSRIA